MMANVSYEETVTMRDPGPTVPEVNDPHKVLEIIRELDDSIARYQMDRVKYLERYKSLMAGINEHYDAVMSRLEQDTGYAEERPSYGR